MPLSGGRYGALKHLPFSISFLMSASPTHRTPIEAPIPANVLLIEDDLLVAEYLVAQLRRLGYTVSGHATTGAEALRLLAATPPQLILCDVRLAHSVLDGIEVVEHLRALEAAARPVRRPAAVLYLTAYSDQATTTRAYATGPVGYLTKPYTDEQFRVAVALALHQAQTATYAHAAGALPYLAPPSRREGEVLRLLAQGLRSKEIANRLHLSDLTVQTHRRNLLQKYAVGNMTELVALAARYGWLTSTGAPAESPAQSPAVVARRA